MGARSMEVTKQGNYEEAPSQTTAELTSAIIQAASDDGVLLVRNNSGFAFYKNGTAVKFGVGTDEHGGGDLIGLAPILITQEMVGQTIGAFLSVEVKIGKDYQKKNQAKWHRWVTFRHGLSGIARSVEDARAIWRGAYQSFQQR